jgi:hypothetical protein
MDQAPESQALGAQQRPQQVGEQAGGDGAAQDQVEHGASDPFASGNIGREQREAAKADAKHKNVDHWWSSCRGVPAISTSNEKTCVKTPFGFWTTAVKSA